MALVARAQTRPRVRSTAADDVETHDWIQFTCPASSRRRSPSALCGEYLYGDPRRQPADSANDVGLRTAIRGPFTAALTRPRRRVHFDRAGRVVDVTSPVVMPEDAPDPNSAGADGHVGGLGDRRPSDRVVISRRLSPASTRRH